MSLPFWLLGEASRRKRKYGHAMPLGALEDAEHAMVSEAALQRVHELNAAHAKSVSDEEAGKNPTTEHTEKAGEQHGK